MRGKKEMEMNEKIFVDINGRKQGMFVQSNHSHNPVLLYVHGGPGAPEIAFANHYATGLEKLFTVCWWEQRGSGISYNRHIDSQEMTFEQMVADTIKVTQYLRSRFGEEKIYIMGHSWGSLLGVLAVKQKPEFFHAYIGIGQVAFQEQSERLAYSYMLEKFTQMNDHKMIRRLREYPIESGGDMQLKYLAGVRSEGLNKLGIGMMHNMPSTLGLAAIVFKYKGYTLREKMYYTRGSLFSLKCLCDEMIHMNLFKEALDLKVPVYIFQGRFDYQVSYVVAKEYAMALKAPIRGFYTFENSAHSPCFEEPDKMCHILNVDVLQNQVTLADTV